MEVSPFWHAFGTVLAAAFVTAIALSITARFFVASENPTLVRFGASVLSLLGGASVARQVDSELKRRPVK